MPKDLPPELWSYIFDLAADEDVIFYPGLPTTMAQSTWFKPPWKDDWQLRTPQDAINMIQRRSYATKKTVIATCRGWRRLGTEFLVRCLFFDNPTKLRDLCAIFDRDPGLGWWARRIHITHFSNGRGPKIDDFENPLISILHHCPNLEIFIVDWPMASSFGPIAETLGAYCTKLRTVHWHVPSETLPKVIWALDSLPSLVSVHIEFDAPTVDSDTITLGAASNVRLNLVNLHQLSLRGFCQEFLEQATGWNFPGLRSFSFDFGSNRHDLPDLVSFLAHHGTQLLLLDLDCIPPLDVCTILDMCPLLVVFSFNPDWKLPSMNGNDTLTNANSEDDFSQPVAIVNRPHEHIKHIGLHGLLYAFGVGYAAEYASVDPLRTMMIRRANDRNFDALVKANFPSLRCVRVLSPTVLLDLDAADGPDVLCFERWERWWNMCNHMGVRLEDCTGAQLGILPQDEEDEEEEVEEEEERWDDDETECEYKNDTGGGVSVTELRQLLDECRKMSAERDNPTFEFTFH
ncbi:hypothetical protein SERLA73DRAFT_174592 [Serpula lacrymans var. lacrymans S7.3]|uniref:F-box domain-containing protein n=2 Tax=Serpula lacrymans var. lacrymans TaxID=341189 RepID=F8PIZ1_SERL3|nr:uncharacterized protein SERLADRAFT_353836 [Serpula lacrymans var. lacrymans S7.9]EGO03152.1 hypothetical protein SERLA73DRAFT_174592 [Serpula lacrymans var. lacrymans S7.3]EGO28937.1 hypothetical protein SERLADRAFT_353836 [Serpula lacrymans var. lacrymans S7.9]